LTTLGLDTTVAVPLLVRTHHAGPTVVRWWDGRDVVLRTFASRAADVLAPALRSVVDGPPAPPARATSECLPECCRSANACKCELVSKVMRARPVIGTVERQRVIQMHQYQPSP
jgi:hypothetical protein